MRGIRSAILAFCAVAVFADAAAAQDAALPPVNVSAPVVTAAANADAAGVGVRVGATVGTSGDASGSPSVGASANAGAAGADVAAGAAAAPDPTPIGVDVTVSTGTSEPAPPVPSSVDRPDAEPSNRSKKPSVRADDATPTSRHATAAAPRPKPTGPVALESDDGVVSALASLRTRDADERRALAPAGDADANTDGGSPQQAVSSSGGVSSVATVLSLAVLLIPLVTWAFEQAAAGSPRSFLVSLLERPG